MVKRQNNILKNQQYQLARKLMTISRFCGILQSDGHFTVSYDKQKVQNPKIILTQTGQRINWLYGIQDWLTIMGINSSLPTQKTLQKSIHAQRSINLTMDRVNCRKLMSLIEETENTQKTPLLFDDKRKNYLLVKESIRIKQDSTQKSLTKNQATILVDIKQSGLKVGYGPQGLSSEQLIERLGFPEAQTKGRADFLIQGVKQKTEKAGEKVIKMVLDNSKQLNSALADYLAGVFDGDGSFSIGLFTHLSQDGTKLNNRHTYEILPSISITTQTEEKHYLFKICNAVFGENKPMNLVNVNTKGKGKRLVIKNTKILKKYVIPFFEEYKPSIQKNQTRFEIFCSVLKELPLNYENKHKNIEMIREIYQTDLYERDKKLTEFLNIVELNYN